MYLCSGILVFVKISGLHNHKETHQYSSKFCCSGLNFEKVLFNRNLSNHIKYSSKSCSVCTCFWIIHVYHVSVLVPCQGYQIQAYRTVYNIPSNHCWVCVAAASHCRWQTCLGTLTHTSGRKLAQTVHFLKFI